MTARPGLRLTLDTATDRACEHGRPSVPAVLRRCGRIVGVVVPRGAAAGWQVASSRARRRPIDERALTRHVRIALEDLGPTFVKLGQLLSARSDLVPVALQHELSTLRDHAPNIAEDALGTELERGVGRTLNDAFVDFERIPVACASIGQVHRATLPDGRRVAVKVRRPGVRADIDGDLALLHLFARVAARISRRARAYDPIGLLDHFATLLRAETDYATEADNIEAVRTTFEHDGAVMIPRVVRGMSSESVLVMDWIDGIPLNHTEELDATNADRAELARSVVHAYVAMIFGSDRFHADPHPGNLIARDDHRLALVDFGEVGTVAATTRAALLRLLIAVVTRDAVALGDAVLAVSRHSRVVDRPRLGEQLASLVTPVGAARLRDVQVGTVLRSLLHVLREHGLALPADLAVLVKTVIVCEATAKELDPTFKLSAVVTELALFGVALREPA